MHHGLEVQKIRSDYWRVTIQYRHGSFSFYESTFQKALTLAVDYIDEDVETKRSEAEETLLEILGQLVQEGR